MITDPAGVSQSISEKASAAKRMDGAKKKQGPAELASGRAYVINLAVTAQTNVVRAASSSPPTLAPQFLVLHGREIRCKGILRKEVIQPQVPLRLPCYDLVPIAEFIFGA